MKDSSGDESRARKGHAPENSSVPGRIPLNLLRQDTTAKPGVKNKRRKAGGDDWF